VESDSPPLNLDDFDKFFYVINDKEASPIDFSTNLKAKRVFLTGHTGFTGSWACIWLNQIGAHTFGYSLLPDTLPNLYTEAKVSELLEEQIGDVRNFDLLRLTMERFQPDLVLHLAAQPLVLRSYDTPRETFEINAQGTINVIEAARSVKSVRGVLCVTTDKVYNNLETGRAFIESDPLGGKDPYSASKVTAEIAIASYRQSFCAGGAPFLSVARGGNIIGGGDWSEDRLVPDFIRALTKNEKIKLRHPEATRPWQHVIALVEGYLKILSGLASSEAESFARAFNLGPTDTRDVSVANVVQIISTYFGVSGFDITSGHPPESTNLSLNSGLAEEVISWSPLWSTQYALEKTAQWYSKHLNKEDGARDLCLAQILEWSGRAPAV
jgi:CDP-glucose 4,6-dehydratase